MANPAADYPTAIHDATDVSAFDDPTKSLGSTTPTHTQLEGKVQSELVALQTKLGIGASAASSAATGALLTKQSNGQTNWAAMDTDLSTIAALTPSNDDVLQRKAGAWTNRTLSQLATDMAVDTATMTLTNKTINLTSNTLTGTTAQFNTALSDDNFVTLTGSETLTNKTLTTPTIASMTNAQHTHADAAGGGQIPFSSVTPAYMTVGSNRIGIIDFGGTPIFGLLNATDTLPQTSLVFGGLQLGAGGVSPSDTYFQRDPLNAAEIGSQGVTRIVSRSTGLTINESGDSAYDVQIFGDTDSNLIRTDSSADTAGVGTATPVAKFHVTQPTIGNEVFRVESVATNDDVATSYFHARTTTTDATVTWPFSKAIPASTTVFVKATVIGRRTGGLAGTAEDSAAYVLYGTFKNVAGTCTQVGTTTAAVAHEDQAAWACIFNPSGANTRVRVTGAADNNVTWHVSVEWSQVSS